MSTATPAPATPDRPRGRVRPHAPRFDATVAFLAASGYLLALALGMAHLSFDIWGAMVVGPVLVAISIPLLGAAIRRESDPRMGRLLVAAFVAKMAGSLVRYAVTFEVYAGRADAGGYHGSGRRLAEAFWSGNWATVYAAEVGKMGGTEFLRLVTGLVYIGTGPTKLGGFLVFSWLGFWGLYWCYRAFRVGFPEGDHRRYALLLFFLPSLLYWPSSIGKEAWMLCTLGLTAYGVALVLRYRTRGYLVLGLGLALTAAVRPHVSLLAFAALFIAYLLRRRSWRDSDTGLLGRLAGLAVLTLIGGLLLTQAASYFHLQDVKPGSVSTVLDRTQNQSATGNSQYAVSRPKSPGEYPEAVTTVLFRPFPWEAGNAQAMVAALEGTFVALLVVLSLPRLARLPRMLVTTPYVTFAAAYTAMFVFAFSSVGNFGIITRQRTQVFPFVLVLLAIPLLDRRSPAPRARRAPPAAEPTEAAAATGAAVVTRPRRRHWDWTPPRRRPPPGQGPDAA
ncbi:MAG TPA: hypothetical protein VKB57_02275 [Acidimicrobiales bacterium]|nr:hypothetical protein [Acidimicrobiales bacterium]